MWTRDCILAYFVLGERRHNESTQWRTIARTISSLELILRTKKVVRHVHYYCGTMLRLTW